MSDSIERVLNCNPSRSTDSDWTFEDALESEALCASASLPSSVDLRDLSWWGVDDQGDTGSCVGWATANSVLRWHFVKAGLLQKHERLSARYVWMASKETDGFVSCPTTFLEVAGTSLKAALDVARKYGVVRESVLPFRHESLFRGSPNAFYATASALKITSYFSLGRNLRAWREWLAFNGPILTRLDVDETWHAATANNGRLDTYRAGTGGGGHAIALVGYGPDGFVVRNSWGEGWGDKGFAFATDAYANAAFTEAYGVVVQGPLA